MHLRRVPTSPSICLAFARVALFSRSASSTAEEAEATASARSATSAFTCERQAAPTRACGAKAFILRLRQCRSFSPISFGHITLGSEGAKTQHASAPKSELLPTVNPPLVNFCFAVLHYVAPRTLSLVIFLALISWSSSFFSSRTLKDEPWVNELVS